MRYSNFYPLEAHSVRRARQEFRTACQRSELSSDIADAAQLCLSELATNAVRYAKDPRPRPWFYVQCRVLGLHDPFLEVAVQDADGFHIPRLPDPHTACAQLLDMSEGLQGGRGLLLVAQQSDGLGVEHGPAVNGKRMWCRWYLARRKAPCDPRAAWAAAVP
jgi:anti-sigma regulatory factor (Ser/Thr protein kinase)